MSAYQLFGNLGRKISSSSGDDREGAFLFQRVSVLVQRFNAVLLRDSLPTPDCTDRIDLYPILYISIFKTPSGTYLSRVKKRKKNKKIIIINFPSQEFRTMIQRKVPLFCTNLVSYSTVLDRSKEASPPKTSSIRTDVSVEHRLVIGTDTDNG